MHWPARRKYLIGAAVLAIAIVAIASGAYSLRPAPAQNADQQHPKTTVGVAVATHADIPITIAQQDVAAQRAMVHQLEGTVVNDRAAVGIARLNLSYCTIVAPIGGQVGLRTVDPGNLVSTTDTTGIVTITQLQPMDVQFTLPADQIVAVQQRVTAGAQLAVTVLDRTLKTTLGHGTFSTLDNQVDAQTGTVRAKARIDNSARLLFPGEFVNVRLLLDTIRNAVAVLSSAVHQGPQGDYVWIVAKDRTVHLRNVRRGPATAALISIQSGVAVGEQVVTEGSDRLTDGATVQLTNASHPPRGASQ